MNIEQITIEKFRSIKKVSFSINDITAIVGENNSGKTSNWDDDIQKGKRYRTILTAFQIGYGIILVDLITLFSRYNLENMYYMGWTLGVDHNKIFLNIVF